jgi:hypothetical protein
MCDYDAADLRDQRRQPTRVDRGRPGPGIDPGDPAGGALGTYSARSGPTVPPEPPCRPVTKRCAVGCPERDVAPAAGATNASSPSTGRIGHPDRRGVPIGPPSGRPSARKRRRPADLSRPPLKVNTAIPRIFRSHAEAPIQGKDGATSGLALRRSSLCVGAAQHLGHSLARHVLNGTTPHDHEPISASRRSGVVPGRYGRISNMCSTRSGSHTLFARHVGCAPWVTAAASSGPRQRGIR